MESKIVKTGNHFLLLIVLGILTTFLSGCGEKEESSNRQLQLTIYYEADTIEECKEQLVNPLKEKNNIICEDYVTNKEMFEEFKEQYGIDDNTVGSFVNEKEIICTIVVDQVANTEEVDAIISSIEENPKVIDVQKIYPFEDSTTVIAYFGETTEKECVIIEGRMELRFYYQAESESECENGIINYLKSKYDVKTVDYINFTDEMKKLKENSDDSDIFLDGKHIYVCGVYIDGVENKEAVEEIAADTECQEKVYDVHYTYPVYKQ